MHKPDKAQEKNTWFLCEIQFHWVSKTPLALPGRLLLQSLRSNRQAVAQNSHFSLMTVQSVCPQQAGSKSKRLF